MIATVDGWAHSASVEVAVPAERAFAFLAEGMNQTYWALGSWNRVQEGDHLFSGTSLWDATKLYIRLAPHEELLLVDFSVGPDPADLRRLVQARVIPGPTVEIGADRCVITLTVWRGAFQSDESWVRTYHAFQAEIHLIKGRLEHVFPE